MLNSPTFRLGVYSVFSEEPIVNSKSITHYPTNVTKTYKTTYDHVHVDTYHVKQNQNNLLSALVYNEQEKNRKRGNDQNLYPFWNYMNRKKFAILFPYCI